MMPQRLTRMGGTFRILGQILFLVSTFDDFYRKRWIYHFDNFYRLISQHHKGVHDREYFFQPRTSMTGEQIPQKILQSPEIDPSLLS